jgi:hypothetical protein
MVTKHSIKIRLRNISAFATTLLAILSIRGIPLAQEHAAHYHHYKFIDLETLGGLHSYGSPNGPRRACSSVAAR